MQGLVGRNQDFLVNRHMLVLKNPYSVNQITKMNTTVNLKDLTSRFETFNGHPIDINEDTFGPETLVLGQGQKLFCFWPNRNFDNEDEVIVEMNKEGYRPGTLGDLLDYGTKNPFAGQNPIPIVALGSITAAGRAPGLIASSTGKPWKLWLPQVEKGFARTCFLGVLK